MKLISLLGLVCLLLGLASCRQASKQDSSPEGVWQYMCTFYDDQGNPLLSEEEQAKKAAQYFEAVQAGTLGQTRYSLYDRVNADTLAGIKDNTLGNTGKAAIRAAKGIKSGTGPHVAFDVRGYPNARAPPVAVPSSVVTGLSYVQSGLSTVGSVLNVVTIAADTWRFGSAMNQDLARYCVDLKLARRLGIPPPSGPTPLATFKTGSSIAGGWTGGLAGGFLGGKAGAATGALVGSVAGPAGTVAGSVLGAIGGALYGGWQAHGWGSKVAETVADNVMRR